MNTIERMNYDKLERDLAKAKKMLAAQDKSLSVLRAEIRKYESSWVVRTVAKLVSPGRKFQKTTGTLVLNVESLGKTEIFLAAYQRALNKIDDLLEYSQKSISREEYREIVAQLRHEINEIVKKS